MDPVEVDFFSRKIIKSATSLMASLYKKGGTVPLKRYIKEEDLKKESFTESTGIVGTYADDCNILFMDKKIKKELSSVQDNSKTLFRINQITLDLSTPHTLIKDKVLRAELKELQLKLEEVEKKSKLKEYITETAPIIEEYRKIRSNLQVVVKIGENIQSNIEENDETYEKRMKLISSFLEIASKYTKVNVHRIAKQNNRCPICEEEYISYDEFYVCPICGEQIAKIKESSIDKEQKDYESKINFIKAFNKLQGKDTIIPSSLYEELDKYCLENSIPISIEIRSMEIDKNGVRGNVNLDLLQKMLKDTGNKNHYEDCPLIASEYWGWSLYDDLEEYRDKIMNEYELLESALRSFKDGDESSSPNVQYKLYRLVKRSYPECHKSHFRLPKDTGKLESKTFKAFRYLGWKFEALAI